MRTTILLFVLGTSLLQAQNTPSSSTGSGRFRAFPISSQKPETKAWKPLTGPVAYPNLHHVLSGPGTSLSTNALRVTALGESVNPYTVAESACNYLYADPQLGSVALIRRGGPNDFAGSDNEPRNKLWVDLNNKKGADDKWHIGKWMIYNNCIYSEPLLAAPRYPQGLIYNPAGNLDTNQAQIVAVASTLTESNGAWGGLARTGIGLASGSQPWQVNAPSTDELQHYLTKGMKATKDGKIFFTEPETDVTSGTGVFLGNILIYRLTYNPSTLGFDTLTVVRSFGATKIMSSAIAFADDGQKGFVVVLGYSPNSNPADVVYSPFVSQTNDGGNTWSPFSFINFNSVDPGVGVPDDFRQSLFGDSMAFSPAGIKHRVQYTTTLDVDAAVDEQNQLHVFTGICIAGFTDTLESNDPSSPLIRPGLGTKLVDVIFKNSITMKAAVISPVKAFRGCLGDCAGIESLTFDNRQKVSRSWTGDWLNFNWLDTDTANFPSANEFPNSNPDIWARSMRIKNGDFNFEMPLLSRNQTAGTNVSGACYFANFSPYMLNLNDTLTTPATVALMSIFTGLTHPWPITHLYLDRMKINKDTTTILPVTVFPVAYRVINGIGNPIESSISTYPNPVTDQLVLDKGLLASFSVELLITNSLGQIVKTETLLPGSGTKSQLNLQTLKPGIYFINLKGNGTMVTHRFIKE